jgi:peptidoglycan/LPS O-acetylase OafA/YrhL
MKKRKLFYKDISGLRFIAIVFILIYVVSYVLIAQESSSFSKTFMAVVTTLKNVGISIFIIISSFLLTANGLREYKYTNAFDLKRFYMRRVIRILPTLLLALAFYFFIHPTVTSILQLNPNESQNTVLNFLLFPLYYQKMNSEVYIYLYFIYGVFVLLQYYVIWGLILKFLKPYLYIVATILLISGLVFKLIGSSDNFTLFLYLPYYFVEIALGTTTAIILRSESAIIEKAKALKGNSILFVYTTIGLIAVASYFISVSAVLTLISKLLIYIGICFYIIEQTYAKHSPFKARNSKFIINFGNLSYSFILFLPIIAVTLLITFESIELEVKSKLITILFPFLTLALTWIISYAYHQTVERFFAQIKKEYKVI